MKQIRKRVLLVLGMAACLFALTACSSSENGAATLDPTIAGALKQQTAGLLKNIISIPADQMGAVIQQNRDSGAEAVAVGLENYLSIADDLGAFISEDGGTVVETKDGYKITIDAQFEKRQADFEVTVDKKMVNIISMTFNPVYTLGEKLEDAGFNTLMGMGTVFILLILISLLISGFRHINVWEEKRKLQKKGGSAAGATEGTAMETPAALPDTQPAENLADDLELAAVITAAIAASENTPADGLVVRSIRRVPAGKWKRS